MRWRALIIAVILGLWLAVGIAGGARAAPLFAFPVFIGCLFAAWAVFAGRMGQGPAGWYYERQSRAGGTGRWRDRSRHGAR